MSVFYRLHQDQSTGTKRSGKWYARADSSDNHAGCYQLYVKERRWADAQRFFVYNRKGVTRDDRAHLLL